jgi:hypothetical protein
VQLLVIRTDCEYTFLPSHIQGRTLVTYSEDDFERIAAAIGKDVADVRRHEEAFEAAAMWYRLNRNGSTVKRTPPSAIKKRMKQIANAAQKLLWHLEVVNYRNAADGPGDFALLEALASTEDGGEDEVIKATAQIGTLEDILKTIGAAQTLEQRAHKAADDAVRMSELTLPKGRRGDRTLNIWIADMMGICEQITGKASRVSVISTGPKRGKPAGPFVRFLEAAIKPLIAEGEPLSLKSLHERVRDLSKDAARRQN